MCWEGSGMLERESDGVDMIVFHSLHVWNSQRIEVATAFHHMVLFWSQAGFFVVVCLSLASANEKIHAWLVLFSIIPAVLFFYKWQNFTPVYSWAILCCTSIHIRGLAIPTSPAVSMGIWDHILILHPLDIIHPGVCYILITRSFYFCLHIDFSGGYINSHSYHCIKLPFPPNLHQYWNRSYCLGVGWGAYVWLIG